MKTKWQKFLGSVLALTVLLSSFSSAVFGIVASAQEGRMQAEADFTKSQLSELDETFSASQGAVGGELTAAESVSDVWNKGEQTNENESVTAESVNVALGGETEMEIMPFLLNNGHGTSMLADGSLGFTATSDYSEQNTVKEAAVTFSGGEYFEIDKINIYWRSGGKGCPVDFEVCVYNGEEWVKVAEEAGYSYSAQLYSKAIEPIKCNAVKLIATKLGLTDNGNYGLQVAEIEAYGNIGANRAQDGSVYMEVPSWASSAYGAAKLTDGNVTGDNAATTTYVDSADTSETVTISFADDTYYTVDRIKLFPRIKNNKYSGGFPIDFKLSVWNGKEWVTVADKNGVTKTDASAMVFSFAATACNALKLEATKLSNVDGGSQFALQLAEIAAYGTQIALTNKALGGTPDMEVASWNANTKASFLNDGSFPGGNDYAMSELESDANTVKTATVTFANGEYAKIKAAGIVWRSSSGCPAAFNIQVYNGSEWVTVAQESGYTYVRRFYRVEFEPIVCNAIRLTATTLGKNGEHYTLELSELEAWGEDLTNVALGGTADVEVNTWSAGKVPGNLCDGDLSTYTWSNQAESADTQKTAAVTFADGQFCKISSVEIVWRDSRGVPTAFKVQYYNGSEWITLSEENEYTYSGRYYIIAFKPVVAGGVRLVAEKLGKYDAGYYLLISEIMAYGEKCENVALGGGASITNPMFPASRLVDGSVNNSTSLVSTNFVTDINTEETAQVDLKGAYHTADAVEIAWRDSRGCPKDFRIDVLTEKGWETVAEETDYVYSGKYYTAALNGKHVMRVRLTATKLGMDGSNYCLQLTEILVFGKKDGYLTPDTLYADGKITMLTVKDMQFKNFKAEIEMLHHNSNNTHYGLYFGQSSVTDIAGAIDVSPQQGQGAISVSNVKKGSSNYVYPAAAGSVSGDSLNTGYFNYGANDITYTYNKGVITAFPATVSTGNMKTLNIEVFEGVIRVWYTGYEDAAWTALLSDDYNGGYVSLYSYGADEGGFKSFKISSITGADLHSDIDVQIESAGKYTVLSINGDFAEGILNTCGISGSLSYDTNKLTYRTVALADENGLVSEVNAEVSDNNGTLTINIDSLKSGMTVRLYFSNSLNDMLNYKNCFNIGAEDISLTAADGETVNTSVNSLKLLGDCTGDNGKPDLMLDIRDLVYAKNHDYQATDLVIIKKALLGVGGAEAEALCTSSLTEVFVDITNKTGKQYGTADAPFSSLETALYNVNDGGVIHIAGSYPSPARLGWSGKSVTVTGGTLDISKQKTVKLCGAVTLEAISVTASSNTLYACGNPFTVKESVNFSGTVNSVYGGNDGKTDIASTNLQLYAGNYTYVYGGSEGGTVTGDTNLVIGGSVNSGLDISNHALPDRVCGGSYNGKVKGNAAVTVKGNARTSIAYGGGFGTGSSVDGTCFVNVEGGKTMGYYGGTNGGTVYNTVFTMTGGETEQIFGGNWNSSLTGNTSVVISGGKVTRRIYGGCYNDTSSNRSDYVNGTASVTLKTGTNFTHTGSLECAICAASRTVNSVNENAVLSVETQALYNQIKTYIQNLFNSRTAYDTLYIAGVKQ